MNIFKRLLVSLIAKISEPGRLIFRAQVDWLIEPIGAGNLQSQGLLSKCRVF